MDQNKLFKTLTVVLLVANVSLMAFILLGKNGRGNGKFCHKTQQHEKSICHKKDKGLQCKKGDDKCSSKGCDTKEPRFFRALDLDSAQQIAFKEQAEAYKKEVKSIRKDIKVSMKLYFSDLKTTEEVTDKAALMDKIQALQKQKIELTYKHFDTLKNLLKDEQKASFDKHVDKAMKCILAKGPEREKHGERGSKVCHNKKSECPKKG